MRFDLVIRGGHVLDPSQGLDARLDVGVIRGRIAAIDRNVENSGAAQGANVVDASGAYVVPGLIDIHAHVYTGVCPLTVAADEMCGRTGVTTVVSAGDAGANTVEGFRQLIFNGSRTRVLAFLHISTIGLATFPVGESIEIDLLNMAAAEAAIARFPDMIVGLKVRQGGPAVTGENGLEPLKRAIAVGRSVGLPVMVHITDSDRPIAELLAILGKGDIVTHCFTGSPNGLRQNGHIVDAARRARERGVLFDVGHGAGSFDFDVAEAAARSGFWPDTISTDLHSISAPRAKSLPDVMAKMLAVGMPFNDVVAAVTSRAAAAISRGDRLGSLRVGSVADVAVLDRHRSPTVMFDTFENERTAEEALVARHTIRAGLVWGAPTHPGTGISVLADAS